MFSGGEKTHGVEQKVDCDAPHGLRIVVVAPESERGRLCVNEGRDHWEYDPRSNRAVHTALPDPEQTVQARLAELERLTERMNAHYVGPESIAGRPAHVVKVFTTEGLPVKKVWIDHEFYVTLKTQHFDSHGNVKSSAYFTRIDFSPLFAPGLFEFAPPDGAKIVETTGPSSRMPLAEAEEKTGFEAVLPAYLPPGYHFQHDRTTVIDTGGKPTIWLTFSNGADTFSLFQRRESDPSKAVERKRCVSWQLAGYRFTLMGTLTPDEAEKVRESIAP